VSAAPWEDSFGSHSTCHRLSAHQALSVLSCWLHLSGQPALLLPTFLLDCVLVIVHIPLSCVLPWERSTSGVNWRSNLLPSSSASSCCVQAPPRLPPLCFDHRVCGHAGPAIRRASAEGPAPPPPAGEAAAHDIPRQPPPDPLRAAPLRPCLTSSSRSCGSCRACCPTSRCRS